MEAALFSFIAFLSTTLGGLFALKNSNKLHYIMSFTAGVLLGVCFFDILPEAFEILSQKHLDTTPLTLAIVAGFLLFHILEKTVLIHHSHEEEYAHHIHKNPTVGLIGALGLVLHSFLDGIGIGLGFHVSNQVGLIIAIAVIAHDFSDGLNTVTIMLTHKNTRKKSLILLILDSIMPIAGAITTYLFVIPQNLLVQYLGFFMGFLLYIGASDLLPEAHSKHSSYKMIALTVSGALFIFAVTRFT